MAAPPRAMHDPCAELRKTIDKNRVERDQLLATCAKQADEIQNLRKSNASLKRKVDEVLGVSAPLARPRLSKEGGD